MGLIYKICLLTSYKKLDNLINHFQNLCAFFNTSSKTDHPSIDHSFYTQMRTGTILFLYFVYLCMTLKKKYIELYVEEGCVLIKNVFYLNIGYI